MKYEAIPALNGIKSLELIYEIIQDPEKIGKVLDEMYAARDEANARIAEANLVDDAATHLAAAEEKFREAQKLNSETEDKCKTMMDEHREKISDEEEELASDRKSFEEHESNTRREQKIEADRLNYLAAELESLKENIIEREQEAKKMAGIATETKDRYLRLIEGIDALREQA